METQYKITAEPHPSERSITLLLTGKFSGDALAELEQSISAARRDRQLVYIDLSEVTLADREAIKYFSQHSSEDVRLVNCPIYLKRWLRQATDEA